MEQSTEMIDTDPETKRKLADVNHIGKTWGAEMVIVIIVNKDLQLEMMTNGRNKELSVLAIKLGTAAVFEAQKVARQIETDARGSQS